MIDASLDLAGTILGWAVIVYAVGAALPGVFGGNLLVLSAIVWLFGGTRWHDRRLVWLTVPIELAYGFINVLLYLTLINRSPPYRHKPGWLIAVTWALFGVVWGTRLAWPLRARGRGSRWVIGTFLFLGMLCVATYLFLDGAGLLLQPTNRTRLGDIASAVWLSANSLALYLVPLALLGLQLRSTTSEDAWCAGRRYFLGDQPSFRYAASAVLVIMALVALVASRHPSEAAARSVLLENRTTIVESASAARISPRTLAALVYVIQTRYVSPLLMALERFTAATAVVMSEADTLNLSIGLAQIKPQTAAQAASFLWAPKVCNSMIGTAWCADVSSIDSPLQRRFGEDEIVETLLDDDGSIHFAGLLLGLYAAQWETADPAWSIRNRPEILATLYQLGFGKSFPKPDPRAIPFGEEVRAAHDSEWIAEHFPAEPPPRAR